MKRTRLAAMLLAVAFAALTAQSALAINTPACTSISNVASLSYTIGGAPLTTLNSDPEIFKVANKVNLEVVTTDIITTVTAPHGGTDMVLTFTVTNTGNMKQDYAISPAYVTGGTAFGGTMTDDFDAGLATAYVEDGTTPGEYNDLEDTDLFIDGLIPGVPATVYVVVAGPVPATTSNGDESVYRLLVTTHEGNLDGGPIGAALDEATPGLTCGEAVVFADDFTSTGPDDGDNDGQDSEHSGLTVTASTALTVSKSSVVYYDPINGIALAPGDAKAIPDAIVTYTIIIENPAGSTATATSVNIVDSLDSQIDAGNIEFKTIFDDGTVAIPCVAGQGIVVDGVCKTNDALDADDANFDSNNAVNVTAPNLAPGESTIIKFQVTIK